MDRNERTTDGGQRSGEEESRGHDESFGDSQYDLAYMVRCVVPTNEEGESISSFKFAAKIQRKLNELEDRGYMLHTSFEIQGNVLLICEKED